MLSDVAKEHVMMQVMKKLSWKYLNTIMLNAIFKNVNNLIFYTYL